jgi:hypothetical protein
MGNRFLDEHVTCLDPRCVAARWLYEMGANLRPGQARFCELAVLAAAGVRGATDGELILGRRSFAKHLGVRVDGSWRDSDTKAVAAWRASLDPTDNHHVPLGRVKVKKEASRYYMTPAFPG